MDRCAFDGLAEAIDLHCLTSPRLNWQALPGKRPWRRQLGVVDPAPQLRVETQDTFYHFLAQAQFEFFVFGTAPRSCRFSP
jgi:hypothetical protein